MKGSTAAAVLLGAGVIAYYMVKTSSAAAARAGRRSRGEQLGGFFGSVTGINSGASLVSGIKSIFGGSEKSGSSTGGLGGTGDNAPESYTGSDSADYKRIWG